MDKDVRKITSLLTTLAVIGVISYAAFVTFKPFIAVMVLSAVLAIFTNPLYEKLVSKTNKKGVSALVSISSLVLGIFIPLVLLSSSLVSEARQLISYLHGNPELISSLEKQLSRLSGLEITDIRLSNGLQEYAVTALQTIASSLGSFLLRTGGVILNSFFVGMTLYFFLTQKDKLRAWIKETVPFPESHLTTLEKRAGEVINGTVRGNLIVIFLQIVVGVSGMLVFGIQSPVLFGTLYGVLSVIPTIGSALVWVPTAIFLYFLASPLVGFMFVVWCLGTNMAIDHYIAPKIIGTTTNLHQLVTMFAVLGGIQAFGPIGIVLGPTAVALALVVLKIYGEKMGDL